MKEMGYELRRGEILNFGKRRHIPLKFFVPKGKPVKYYDQTRRGLGYINPSAQSDLEFDRPLLSHSSDSSEWESNVSVGLPSRNSSST